MIKVGFSDGSSMTIDYGNTLDDCKAAEVICKLIVKETTGSTSLTPSEHDLGVAGEKVACIKSIRSRTGLGLKESKELYERFYP